jgi:hypothetical protein
MAEQKRDPVEYIVLEKSLIGNEIFEAGTTVKYDGLPAENLQPTCDEGAPGIRNTSRATPRAWQRCASSTPKHPACRRPQRLRRCVPQGAG